MAVGLENGKSMGVLNGLARFGAGLRQADSAADWGYQVVLDGRYQWDNFKPYSADAFNKFTDQVAAESRAMTRVRENLIYPQLMRPHSEAVTGTLVLTGKAIGFGVQVAEQGLRYARHARNIVSEIIDCAYLASTAGN